MYILDTDTLSHLQVVNENVIRAIQRLDHAEITTTIVTKIKMLRGRIDYILKAQTNEDILTAQRLFYRTEELLAQIEIISITPVAADQLAQLATNSKFRKIGRADLIIASMTLAHRATLVTRNLRHFK